MLVALLSSGRAGAEEDRRPSDWTRWFIEESGIFGFMVGWYYTHIDFSGEDVELKWDWPDWDRKLTSFPHFDTNGFYTNAISHGLAGTLEYQAARANGFGVGASTLVAFGGTMLWEYVIEYRERPSLNDIVVNTGVGLEVGEPLVQLARALRRGRPTAGRWLLSAAVSPFDLANDALDGRLRVDPEPAPFLRDRVFSGGRLVRAEDSDRAEVSLGLDLELADQPGYGAPGRFASWTHTAAWSRLDARLDLLPGGRDAGVVGSRISTRMSLFGHYEQDLGDDPDGARGAGRFAGVAMGFDFDNRLLTDEWDKLAILHVVGPALAYDVYLGPATLRWDLGAFADLSMVQALVFGPVLPFAPSMPPTSTLRSKGYYFAYGPTLESRLRLELGRWRAALAVRGHAFWSLDGLDRTEMGGPEDPHDIQDQRLFGHLEVGVPLGRSRWGLALTGDLVWRRGAWGTAERSVLERSAGLYLTVAP